MIHNCPHYKPIYRKWTTEREDKYGMIWEYQDEVLVAEFCCKIQNYILGAKDCSDCLWKVNKRESFLKEG